MKVRLLKKLRKRYRIVYYPGKGEYSLYICGFKNRGFLVSVCSELERSKNDRRFLILEDARRNYKKYGKSIQID